MIKWNNVNLTTKGTRMNLDGKLVNAYMQNPCNASAFSGFEIVTLREFNDYQGGTILQEVRTAEDFLDTDEWALDEPFYRVFGVYKKELNKSRRALGDFYNVRDAMSLITDLTGNSCNIYSI